MPTVNMTLRIDEDLRKEGEKLFAQFGLSMSRAVALFVSQAVREQRIPFEITMNPKKGDEPAK